MEELTFASLQEPKTCLRLTQVQLLRLNIFLKVDSFNLLLETQRNALVLSLRHCRGFLLCGFGRKDTCHAPFFLWLWVRVDPGALGARGSAAHLLAGRTPHAAADGPPHLCSGPGSPGMKDRPSSAGHLHGQSSVQGDGFQFFSWVPYFLCRLQLVFADPSLFLIPPLCCLTISHLAEFTSELPVSKTVSTPFTSSFISALSGLWWMNFL